jgi:histone H3/H4
MAKAKKGSSRGGGAGMGAPKEMLLVASKVKSMIKDAGCNTAGDALDGLNGYVGWLVQQAARRAAQNGRKTVRAHDFLIM